MHPLPSLDGTAANQCCPSSRLNAVLSTPLAPSCSCCSTSRRSSLDGAASSVRVLLPTRNRWISVLFPLKVRKVTASLRPAVRLALICHFPAILLCKGPSAPGPFWLFLAVGYDGQISFFRRAVRTITCHNASQVAQTCSVRCVLLFSSPKYIKSHVAARAHAMIDPRAIAAFAAVVIIVSHFMRIQREALRIATGYHSTRRKRRRDEAYEDWSGDHRHLAHQHRLLLAVAAAASLSPSGSGSKPRSQDWCGLVMDVWGDREFYEYFRFNRCGHRPAPPLATPAVSLSLCCAGR